MTDKELFLNQMTHAKALYDQRNPGTFKCYYDIYLKYPNNPYVCECLGHCLYNGVGIQKNREKAREWFVFAAQNGDANAVKWIEMCNAPQVSQMPNNSQVPPIPNAGNPSHYAQSAGQQLPNQSANSTGSNIGAMIVSLIFCVIVVGTPFFETIKYTILFSDHSGSMYQILKVFKAYSELVGDANVALGVSFLIAILAFLVAIIAIILAVVALASSNIKAFWNSIRTADGVMMLIDLVALFWVLVINNETDLAEFGFTPLYFILAVLALVVIIICSTCSRKLKG